MAQRKMQSARRVKSSRKLPFNLSIYELPLNHHLANLTRKMLLNFHLKNPWGRN